MLNYKQQQNRLIRYAYNFLWNCVFPPFICPPWVGPLTGLISQKLFFIKEKSAYAISYSVIIQNIHSYLKWREKWKQYQTVFPPMRVLLHQISSILGDNITKVSLEVNLKRNVVVQINISVKILLQCQKRWNLYGYNFIPLWKFEILRDWRMNWSENSAFKWLWKIHTKKDIIYLYYHFVLQVSQLLNFTLN